MASKVLFQGGRIPSYKCQMRENIAILDYYAYPGADRGPK